MLSAKLTSAAIGRPEDRGYRRDNLSGCEGKSATGPWHSPPHLRREIFIIYHDMIGQGIISELLCDAGDIAAYISYRECCASYVVYMHSLG